MIKTIEKKTLGIIFSETIEEICFLVQLLVGDVFKENEIIVKLYRDLFENGYDDSEEIAKCLEDKLLAELKERRLFSNNEEYQQNYACNIKNDSIDDIISNYVLELRQKYSVEKDRLLNLKKNIML